MKEPWKKIAGSDLIERKLKEQAMHIEELCKHMEIEIGGSDLNREDIILLYWFPCSWCLEVIN